TDASSLTMITHTKYMKTLPRQDVGLPKPPSPPAAGSIFLPGIFHTPPPVGQELRLSRQAGTGGIVAWEFSGTHEAHPAVLANLPAELRRVFLQAAEEPARDVVPPGADSGSGDTGQSRRVRHKVKQHHHGVTLAAMGFSHGGGEGVDAGSAPLKEDMAEDDVPPRIDKPVVAARTHGGQERRGGQLSQRPCSGFKTASRQGVSDAAQHIVA